MCGNLYRLIIFLCPVKHAGFLPLWHNLPLCPTSFYRHPHGPRRDNQVDQDDHLRNAHSGLPPTIRLLMALRRTYAFLELAQPFFMATLRLFHRGSLLSSSSEQSLISFSRTITRQLVNAWPHLR